MNKIEMNLKREDLDSQLYPKLRNQVFHYTTKSKLEKIMESGFLLTSGSKNLSATSIHSNSSTGQHLGAVCLFDLRDKTDQQIAPGKSYYNFLSPHVKISSVAYLVLSSDFYTDLKTLNEIDEWSRTNTMYLPEIESWHLGHLRLEKISTIYVVNLID